MRNYRFIFAFGFMLIASLFASCNLFNIYQKGEDSFTEDNGIEISHIRLDKTSMILIGTKNKTQAVINGTAYPGYATTKQINWTVDNPDIVKLSAKTGSSVTVTLVKEGRVVLKASSDSGIVTAECVIDCYYETTAPQTVKDLQLEANGNNFYLQWTNPEDFDDDYDGVVVKTFCNGSLVKTDKFNKNDEYGWVKNLKAETTYDLEIYSSDLNGNLSKKQTVNATTKTISKETPEPVIIKKMDVKGDCVIFEWESSVTPGVQLVEIKTFSNKAGASIPETVKVRARDKSCGIYGLTSNTAYDFEILTYGSDFVKSNKLYLSGITGNSASEFKVEIPDFGGTAYLYWKDPALDFARLKVSAESDGCPTETAFVEKGKEKYAFVNLLPGVTYQFKIETLDALDAQVSETTAVQAKTKKIWWRIYNAYSSGNATVVPNYTSDFNHGNVVAPTKSLEEYTYTKWLYTASVDKPFDSNQFSLRAAKENGEVSDYYMCVDRNRDFPAGEYNSGMGGCPGFLNGVFALTLSDLLADMSELCYASISLFQSGVSESKNNGTSKWYGMGFCPEFERPFYVKSSYLCLQGNGAYRSTSIDYAFCYLRIDE